MRKSIFGMAIPLLWLMVAIPSRPGTSQGQDSVGQWRDGIENRIIEALERRREGELRRLVEENRHTVFTLVNELLDTSLVKESEKYFEAAEEKHSQADRLAVLYHEIFGVASLSNRVRLCHGWSKEEKRTKMAADSIFACGTDLFQRSEFRPAARSCSLATEIYVGLRDTLGAANSLYCLGDAHSYLGSYGEALKHYETARSFSQKMDDKKREGRSLYGIGWVYHSMGQFERAVEYYHQARGMLREVGDRQGEARVILREGVSRWALDENDKAADCWERSLTMLLEMEDYQWASKALNNLGLIQSKVYFNHQKALDYYKQSVEIARTLGYQRGECINLSNMGNEYYELGQHDQAVEYYRSGLEIARQIGDKDLMWNAWYALGSMAEKEGHNDEAITYYQQCIDIAESIWQGLGAQSLKTQFLIWRNPVYFSVVNLLVQRGRFEEAFAYTERRKARTLLGVLAEGEVHLPEPLSAELKREREELIRSLSDLNERLSEAHTKSSSNRDAVLIATLQDSLSNVRRRHQEIVRRIELEHPKYAELTGISEPLTVEEVQEKILQHGEALIEYVVGEESSIVWVVSEDDVQYVPLEIDRTEIDSLVRELRRPFREVKEGKITNKRDIHYDLSLAQEVYRRIFRPVEDFLKTGNNLIIVPDDVLYYLPFEALVADVETTSIDEGILYTQFECAEYLVERYAISYAPSASVLNPQLRRSDDTVEGKRPLLAFGNPDFRQSGGTLEIEDEKRTSGLLALLVKDGEGWSFKPLSESEEEVTRISEIIEPSLVYIGPQAKEEYFKAQAGDYNILHISTHAIVEEHQPMYSRIVFAQDSDPAEDGFLQTFEIFDLDLNADLVVLSACETGLGALSRGEGLIGLTRAFMYAGVSSLVVSLWSVDESTCRLMSDFYMNMDNGMTKAEALRQAKIKLIHTRDRGISFSHPFLWAPFVLVGERH